MTRTVASTIGAALGLVVLTATCTGSDAPDVVNPTVGSQQSATTVVRYTPEELHANNPTDWVGQAHNLLVREMIRELRKPDVKIRDLCDRMKKVLQDKDVLRRLDPRFMAADPSVRVGAVAASPLCTSKFKWSKQVRLASLTTQGISQAAEEAIDDAVAQLDIATSPTNLASLLSPILTASYQMSGYDAEAVQAAVSVSQSSMELWYDGTEYAGVETEVFTELDQCGEGNYEEGTYEVDDITYICRNSQWVQASSRGDRAKPLFRNAALMISPAAVSAVCGPPLYGLWVTDGIGIAIGAKAGWSGGPGYAIVGAGIGATLWSGGFALYRAYKRYTEQC